MVSRADTSRLTSPPPLPAATALPLPAVGAAIAAALVAIGCLVMPADVLEMMVVSSGIAALVDTAAPPLGSTARMMLAVGGSALVAAFVWAVLVRVAGERRVSVTLPSRRLPVDRTRRGPGSPTVRRADAHPDAPPRPPILAERDLGVPFLSIVAPAEAIRARDERTLPEDLDIALAAIDPAALLDMPREPVRPVAPLAIVAVPPRPLPSPAPTSLAAAPPLAPGEWIDSVQLTVDGRDRPDTIESLLARLERGTRWRAVGAGESARPMPKRQSEPVPASEPQGGSLEETLGSLRRLATRG